MRRRILASVGGKPLPYDAEVEYLEGVGNQAIDTGHDISIPLDCEYRAECTVPVFESSWAVWFGTTSVENTRNMFFRTRTSIDSLQVYEPRVDSNYYVYESFKVKAGDRASIVIRAGYASFNGVSLGSFRKIPTTSTITNKRLFLFAQNTFVSDARKMKFFSFHVLKDGLKILDFVPVRKGNEGFMFERINGTEHHNVGTGAFVIGPDKT